MRNKIKKKLLEHSEPGTTDDKGYLSSIEENLIATVFVEDFTSNLEEGDGNELKRKFKALHSSSALGVNFFGFFKRHFGEFTVFKEQKFEYAQFEKKLPTGLRKHPNLDFYLENKNCIMGFESKFLETLSRKRPKIQSAYSEGFLSSTDIGLNEIVNHYRNTDKSYYLDTAQLIKHSIGLIANKKEKKAKLIYIYWEPLNAHEFPIYQEHKKELEEFAGHIKSVREIEFHHLTYFELYSDLREKSFCKQHLENFKNKYFFEINKGK